MVQRGVANHPSPCSTAPPGLPEMLKRDLPGYAIGGLSGGESKDEFWKIVKLTASLLPPGKPRYCMGVGYAVDLVVCVALGVDMFDCVFPTRTAVRWYQTNPRPLGNAHLARSRAHPCPATRLFLAVASHSFSFAWRSFFGPRLIDREPFSSPLPPSLFCLPHSPSPPSLSSPPFSFPLPPNPPYTRTHA